MGEWVDPDALPEATALPEPGPPPDSASSSWMVSSMDLLNGIDVSEDHDTSPGDLFDDPNAHRRSPDRD